MSDFELPLEDTEYLNANYPEQWDKLAEGAGKWGVKIDNYVLPAGYDREDVTLMVQIPSGYPATPMDMFYLYPPISKNNSKPIEALAHEVHFGINWQRWSRHYSWEAGEDSLFRHLGFVKEQLEQEIRK